MATRKTSTRAKTKTSKKTVKPVAKAARTSKVSTKVTAIKAVARKSKNLKVTKREALTLGRLLAIGTVLFLGLAIAAGLLMQNTAFPLTLTHLTNDGLLSQDSTVFVTASKAFWDIELRWLVAGLMILSAVLPVMYLTKLKDFYAERIVGGRVISLRWADLAVSGALMVMIIALLSGHSDITVLKLMGGFIGITGVLGWLAEKQNESATKPVWSAFVISLVTGALPWIAIGATQISTLLFGAVRSPWYVYALSIATLAGFVLLAVNQWNQHRRFGSWADYAVVERNYLLISTITKISFAAILIIGLS